MIAALRWMMAIGSFFSFFMPFSIAIDPNCDFYQELVIGTEYYIYNLEYPQYYPPSISCRWIGKSPEDTNIVISCENIEIPSSTNCEGDRLSVSLVGDQSFKNATNYCGKTAVTLVTENNELVVGLFATSDSTGGRFVCALTAIQAAPHTTTTEKPNTCDCGWRRATRIIGGHETGVNEYPLMSALLDATTAEVYCGASIISNRYALTAAHCFLHQQPSNVGLLVGDHNLTTGSDTSAAALYRIIEFKEHPFYDSSTQQNDIGIVKTQLSIKFSLFVGPACLPFRYTLTDFYTQTVTALGWGFLDFSGPKADTLQAVDLSVVSNQECAAAIPDPVSANQICTYAPKKDACFSDSGGPILWQDPRTKRLQLIGIISYGIGCATSKPAVNTRVTSYLSWITSSTSDAVYCIK